jgi:hypothetical protein
MHKYFVLALIALSFLGGCSRQYNALDPAKKKKLVSELISSNSQCSIYKEKLKSPTIEDDDVDAIYHEALKAHCINKDV